MAKLAECNRRQLRVAVWTGCLFSILMFTQTANAQLLYGSLVGNVKDATEAAIPGATVTITNVSTNQVRSTTTNETGGYSLPTVEPGTYTLRVAKEGFQSFTQRDLVVTINHVGRADVTLLVGALTESVTVTSDATPLQTDRAEVRAEIVSRELTNLPVALGRNYQQLFRTLPGFAPPVNAHSIPSNPSRALAFNANGTSRSSNNTRIDGASSMNNSMPHIVAYVPTLEAIETVNVVTNSFDAEQGLAGGAAINVRIKSGTNEVHGSLFEHHTGQRLKAKPFILPVGERKPKLVYNEFGGTIGGPVKRDRLFYFVSYESTYDRESASRFSTVPTAAIKSGDMSASPNRIYDPATGNERGENRVAFPNNLVPASRVSRVARRIADLTPLPNLDLLQNNHFTRAPFRFDRHRADTKVNWNASQKLSMFGRFSVLDYESYNRQVFGDALGGPAISNFGGNPGTGSGTTYSLTAAGTYTFSANLILDAYFGYTKLNTTSEQPRLDEKVGLDFLGLPGTNGPRRFEGGWPRFRISNYSALGTTDTAMPYFRHDPQHQYVANFNWTRGSHNVRFGLDLYRQDLNRTQVNATGAFEGAAGGFNFTGGPTVLRGGPSSNQFNSYAAFLLGLPAQVGKVHLVPDGYGTRTWLYSFYARDQWTVTRKLTFSYGLRWEYFPFPVRTDRGLERYDLAANKMLVCGAGAVPKDCGVQNSKRLLAPRVGLAYRATHSLVFRAGYGITNDPLSLARPLAANYPVNLILNVEGPNSFQPAGRLENGIPVVPIPNLGNGIIDMPSSLALVTVLRNFDRGYVQSWNFTVQKNLRWGFVGEAGYVATRQVRQLGTLDVNAGQVIGAGNAGRPFFQRFGRTADTTVVAPLGTGQYNALQTRLERRFFQGLQIAAHYTWSKTMGVVDNSDNSPRVRSLPYFNLNRTLVNYDRPHNLQITNIWEVPFGKGRRWMSGRGMAPALLGGWQVNNILSFMSGTPFSVSASGTSLDLPGSTQRADQVKPKVQKLGGAGRGQSFFDPLAFRPVTEPRFGTAGFNSLRGPGVVNWDVGLFREFAVKERWTLQFRAEAFNFTNSPHFNNPGTNVSNMTLNADGTVRSLGGYTEVTSVSSLAREGIDERQFRLGLKISF